MSKKSYLHLADGDILEGWAFGHESDTEGEVVFSTGMTGYTESLTDPSFAGEILVFTYPLIGNYGVPKAKKIADHLLANFESEKIWARGVVVSSFSEIPSHYESYVSFDQWLKHEKIPGICGIDTRALTQKLRETGVIMGSISSSNKREMKQTTLETIKQVSLDKTVRYKPDEPNGKHIALIDCGVKHGIIRELLRLGYQITRVPHTVNPLDVGTFDGVLCSNGPGDPKEWTEPIENIRKIIAKQIPYLGICLGHQLLSLAIGANTYKLPYGHRGLNQPCLDLKTSKAYITSQNHGYAVERKTIPKGYEEWFVNLNDQTVEGIRHTTKNIKSVQFHPEGCPGPFDTRWIYEFV